MSRNAFLLTNPHVWEKMPIEGAIHLRSHNIPSSISIVDILELDVVVKCQGAALEILSYYSYYLSLHFPRPF